MKEFASWLGLRALAVGGVYLLLAAMWGMPPFGHWGTTAGPNDLMRAEGVPVQEDYDQGPYSNWDEDDYAAESESSWRDYVVSGAWSCSWSPTYNDDWHDDVICTNGVDRDRPYLLPNDGFVTQEEIMAAAADYEAELNR